MGSKVRRSAVGFGRCSVVQGFGVLGVVFSGFELGLNILGQSFD